MNWQAIVAGIPPGTTAGAHLRVEFKLEQVVAVVRRQREEVAEPAFQAACMGERWQVPIVEVVCSAAESDRCHPKRCQLSISFEK